MTPGQEVVEEAFAAYDEWQKKWADDLEEVGVVKRTTVYMYMLEGIDIYTAISLAALETE